MTLSYHQLGTASQLPPANRTQWIGVDPASSARSTSMATAAVEPEAPAGGPTVASPAGETRSNLGWTVRNPPRSRPILRTRTCQPITARGL